MPLQAVNDPNKVSASVAPAKGKATVEQTYQKLTQHQHIMQRPDTYVGSLESQTADMWVFDEASGRMAQRKISYVPGLYKIFDEILVNAADHKQRDNAMTELKVEIDAEKGRISVFNNGRGIPVAMHKEHNIYVPELVFGVQIAAAPREVEPGESGESGEKLRTPGLVRVHSCLTYARVPSHRRQPARGREFQRRAEACDRRAQWLRSARPCL